MSGMRGVLKIMLLGFAGCIAMAGATGEQLTRRSSFDLDCAVGELRYHRIDDRTQGVVGCGRRATYVESCDGPPERPTTTCTWVLNGNVESAPSRAAAPPPAMLPPPPPPPGEPPPEPPAPAPQSPYR